MTTETRQQAPNLETLCCATPRTSQQSLSQTFSFYLSPSDIRPLLIHNKRRRRLERLRIVTDMPEQQELVEASKAKRSTADKNLKRQLFEQENK